MDRLAPPTWSQAERGSKSFPIGLSDEEFTKKLKKMFDERELEK